MKIANVRIEHQVFSLDTPFSYEIPNNLNVLPGVRVGVPFNNTTLVGYVMSVEELDLTPEEYEAKNGFPIKMINEVIDEEPLLNDELLEVAKYMAHNTVSSLISCLQTMLPPSLKPNSSNHVKMKLAKYVRVIDSLTGEKITSKQEECYYFLKPYGEEGYKKSELPFGESIIKSLVKKNIVEIFNKEVYRNPYQEIVPMLEKEINLTSEQESVINEIKESKDNIFLLEGVTGSGKTEVYIQLTKYYLEQGKKVLFLVPEISLTPQMVRRFKERVGDCIAVFHSGLSNGEKYDEYRRILRNEVNVVIGARSAIFAPLKDIGVIILDEEHSEAYKQDSMPRYHARDIAIFRAKQNKAKVVLGSATPSLETKARAWKNVYHQLYLKNRISNHGLPQVEVVDMLKEIKSGNYSIFSNNLKGKINKCLENNEQVLLLLNKRGYAHNQTCKSCGYTFTCPHCDVPLTYHKNDNTLKCHYCGLSMPKQSSCPHCGSSYLRSGGFGTQKVEEELEKLFPYARVARMDYDSATVTKKFQSILDDFGEGKYDILLGTQMIAKGLDFANITLVGVLNADIGLSVDYRAGERTFDLLAQVVGRSGRSEKKGYGIIQTNNADHYAIKYAAKQDYEGFYKEEMQYRLLRKYPPYRYITSLMLSSKNREILEKKAYEIKHTLEEYRLKDFVILGPAEPYLAKLNDQYRLRLLLKYKDSATTINLLHQIKEKMKGVSNVNLAIDVNPLDD